MNKKIIVVGGMVLFVLTLFVVFFVIKFPQNTPALRESPWSLNEEKTLFQIIFPHKINTPNQIVPQTNTVTLPVNKPSQNEVELTNVRLNVETFLLSNNCDFSLVGVINNVGQKTYNSLTFRVYYLNDGDRISDQDFTLDFSSSPIRPGYKKDFQFGKLVFPTVWGLGRCPLNTQEVSFSKNDLSWELIDYK